MSPRTHRLESALASVLLLAIPPALVLTTGSPLRLSAVPNLQIRLAADLVWAIWAWCAAGVLRGTVSRVSRRDLSRGAHGRVLDSLSIRLAAMVLALIGVLSPSLPGGAATGPSSKPLITATSTTTASQIAPSTTTSPTDLSSTSTTAPSTISSPTDSPATSPTALTSYVVKAGDCLWSIAEEEYGDGDAWTTIAQANVGHLMSDGRLFVNPSLIYPGWVLSLPGALAPPATETAPASPSPAPDTSGVSPVTSPPLSEREDVPTTSPTTHEARTSPSPSSVAPVIDGAVVVAGVLGSGTILLGLLRRRRRRLGPLELPADDRLLDADVDLAHLDLVPTTTLLERAVLLCDLDDALHQPALLELDGGGARLWEGGRSVWRAEPAELLDTPEFHRAPCAVVPLGSSGESTWSLLVPPDHVGLLGGARASELIDEALRLQTEFVWGHLVINASDGASDDLGAHEAGVLHSIRSAVPRPGAAALAREDLDATIIVTDGSTELREHSLILARERLSPTSSELFDALPPVQSPEPGEFVTIEHDSTDTPWRVVAPATSPAVRLLTAIPRLDALPQALEPRRERRAVELVAYLALHRPDPVTGERLRTRVLGTNETDAAAKTLFNVASAARRALGQNDMGAPLLPPASRQGHYQLDVAVGCDVTLFYEHLARAEATGKPEHAIAELRAALELIEAEPLSSVLVGWEWFIAEGHRGRLDGAIERAGELVVSLCLNEGLAPLAEQCLARAQSAVPFSETLAAAAMEVAGALGDADRLRRAFDAYGRLIEELEPGSWPLRSAEERYRELRGPMEGTQASLAAMDAAPRSTRPSAPAAL